MIDPSIDPGFAPANPTDDRKLGDWETRYEDPNAKKRIRFEAIYLAIHLVGALLVVFVLAVLREKAAIGNLPMSPHESRLSFGWEQILHVWLGGVLGGSLFSVKWLIHVVAKNLWNIDRRLWRLFTPHVSGALALAFVTLMVSGILVIIDVDSLSSIWVCFGLGFLVGYFSDTATAKLSEMAQTLFGSTMKTDFTSDHRDAGTDKA